VPSHRHEHGHCGSSAIKLAPAYALGERPLLERLVTNLVLNAIKYNVPDGRVYVTVAAPARLVVVNTGPAVPPDQVGALFEPFRRQSGDGLDHGGGAGLGLTIARLIVAAHWGHVQATANPDGGLTVEVTLPAQ
jgi:signal transduction histidine kinase